MMDGFAQLKLYFLKLTLSSSSTAKALINTSAMVLFHQEKRDMDILLIYPSQGRFKITPKAMITIGALVPPLGILYLARMLQDQGHRVSIVDCSAERTPYETIERMLPRVDVVGMTVYSGPKEQSPSLAIANMVKEQTPDVPLIIGGPHCSIFPEQALQMHHAQVCMLGEGEYRINDVIDGLQGTKPFSSIPGIVYKDGDALRSTGPAEQIKDLDAIPFPARELVRKYDYGYSFGVKVIPGAVTSMMCSRGCPFHCTFCQREVLQPTYQAHSTQHVMDEIDEVVRSGYTSIMFADDNFLMNKKKSEAIMDHIIHQGYDLRLWILNARVDSADPVLYAKLRKAGVEHIIFGVESGDQEVLDFYNKKITLAQIREAVTLSHKVGIFTDANFILGAPIETRRHIRNTVRFAQSIPLDNAFFYALAYMAKSQLWKDAVREGKIDPQVEGVFADRDRGLGNFTQRELEALCHQAYLAFLLNPSHVIREIVYALTHHNSRYIQLGLRFLLASNPVVGVERNITIAKQEKGATP
jgi:anaerobic magnesium-protoporphyrin IX monomethyl ester cyclase